jgi:hypothetical protein
VDTLFNRFRPLAGLTLGLIVTVAWFGLVGYGLIKLLSKIEPCGRCRSVPAMGSQAIAVPRMRRIAANVAKTAEV